MTKLTIFPAVYLLIVSCNSERSVSFNVHDKHGNLFMYKMTIPKGFKIESFDYEHSYETIYKYADSSLLFFSNDVYPGAFKKDAYKKYGNDLNIQFLASDTLEINGRDEDGRYWKDQKNTNVLIGYRRVAPSNKQLFERAIKSKKLIKIIPTK